MINRDQILKVLRKERECIDNCKDHCWDNCDLYCPYFLTDEDRIEVLDHLIKVCEQDAIILADISEEDKKEIIQRFAKAGYGIADELKRKYLTGDEDDE